MKTAEYYHIILYELPYRQREERIVIYDSGEPDTCYCRKSRGTWTKIEGPRLTKIRDYIEQPDIDIKKISQKQALIMLL